MTSAKPKLGLSRPSAARDDAARAAKKLQTAASVRLVLEITRQQRQSLKVRAAQMGLTVKDYVLIAVGRMPA